MINNDVLRRVRYIFDLDDSSVISIFASVNKEVTRSEISDWLKKDDDEAFVEMRDINLALFLNGFINLKRGQKEGESPKAEKRLTNNLILRKIMISLSLKSEDVLDILKLADLKVSKPELSALFRKPEHKHYRVCKDQFLRNFLMGLQLKLKP